jgi:hypothetical protein
MYTLAAFKSFLPESFIPPQQSTAMIVGLLNYVWSNQSFYLLGIANTIALVISMQCWVGHGQQSLNTQEHYWF